MAESRRAAPAISALIRSTVSIMFAPGCRPIPITTAGFPFEYPEFLRSSIPSVTFAMSLSRTGAPFRYATINGAYCSGFRSWSVSNRDPPVGRIFQIPLRGVRVRRSKRGSHFLQTDPIVGQRVGIYVHADRRFCSSVGVDLALRLRPGIFFAPEWNHSNRTDGSWESCPRRRDKSKMSVSDGLILRYHGRFGRLAGNCPAAALMAACTSRAAALMSRSRSN